jgi:nucleotide-binding universal stress UspA family protein
MPLNQTPRVAYRKILYVTDLSEAGRIAFPHAASLAHLHQAELTVLHVIEPKEFEKYLVGYMSKELWEQLKTRDLDEARRLLVQRKRSDAELRGNVEEFCEDCQDQRASGTPYVSYDVKVESGDPVEKILEQAHSGRYDLVVIAKHGHGVVHGGLMGDTVRRVLRRCNVPVLVVPAADEEGVDR